MRRSDMTSPYSRGRLVIVRTPSRPAMLPPGRSRLLGRPRVEGGEALRLSAPTNTALGQAFRVGQLTETAAGRAASEAGEAGTDQQGRPVAIPAAQSNTAITTGEITSVHRCRPDGVVALRHRRREAGPLDQPTLVQGAKLLVSKYGESITTVCGPSLKLFAIKLVVSLVWSFAQ